MTNFFARQGAAYANEMKRSLGALVGIAQGVLSDRQLVDDEIQFLSAWLMKNDPIAAEWPGDVIHQRVRAALADGVITEAERAHLVQTLQQLIGGALDDLAASLISRALPSMTFRASSSRAHVSALRGNLSLLHAKSVSLKRSNAAA